MKKAGICKTRIFFVLFALSAAFAVLLISLQSANSELSPSAVAFKQRRFYVQKEILPDHVLYPIMMAFDRFRLEMAEVQERPALETAYTQRRIYYAVQLLEKQEADLAFTTLSKALKYQDSALILTRKNLDKNPDSALWTEIAKNVLLQSQANVEAARPLQEALLTADQASFGQLLQQTEILQKELENSLFNQEKSLFNK
jgi:hypothetical protein